MRSNLQHQKIIKAYLYPPIRKTGVPYSGRYHVEFDGNLIVDDSRDPECDLARALLSRRITGTVEVIDAITGTHRCTITIGRQPACELWRQEHGPASVGLRHMQSGPPLARSSCP
jgi:hypothetical protein